MIVHKGRAHPGGHAAIVEQYTFDAVQHILDANARRRGEKRRICDKAPLTGRIFDTNGQPMSPTFSYGRQGKLYRYYVSSSLQTGMDTPSDAGSPRRVSAITLERSLTATINRLLGNSSTDPLKLIRRVDIHQDEIELLLPNEHHSRVRKALDVGEYAEPNPTDLGTFRLTLPICIINPGWSLMGGGPQHQTGARARPGIDQGLAKGPLNASARP